MGLGLPAGKPPETGLGGVSIPVGEISSEAFLVGHWGIDRHVWSGLGSESHGLNILLHPCSVCCLLTTRLINRLA